MSNNDLKARLLANDSGSNALPGKAPPKSNLCEIQFLAGREFSIEGQGDTITVEVIRVGNTEGTCSVDYVTEDRAAKAGEKYIKTQGTLVLASGESTGCITIPKMNDDQYIPVSSFLVRISNPVGCHIDRVRDICRVTIMDDDCFPSNELKDLIEAKRVGEIPVMQILYAYYAFVFNIYGVGTNIKWVLVGDQVHNLYSLAMNFLNAYLIKTVLVKAASPSELFSGDHYTDLYLLGFATLSPYVLFFVWDLYKAHLGTADRVCSFLQESIFRTYFNLHDSVRTELSTTYVNDVMLHETHTAAFVCLTGSMNLVSMLIGLSMNVYFTVRKAPQFSIYFILFTVAFCILLTYEIPQPAVGATKGPPKLSVGQRFTNLVASVARNHNVIEDYNHQPNVIDMFNKLVDEGIASGIKGDVKGVSKKYFPQVLSALLAALYMAVGGSAVVAGTMDLGSFLVTLKIIQAQGGALQKLHGAVLTILKSASSIRVLAQFLRLHVDIKSRKQALHDRKIEYTAKRDVLVKKRDALPAGSPLKAKAVRDMMDIEVCGVTMGYGKNAVLDNFTAKVEQGTLTAIIGSHSCGKQTLCKAICGVLVPDSGHVFVPAHLRCLHVGGSLVMGDSLWENLVYGITDPSDIPSFQRVESILGALTAPQTEGVQETMLMNILAAEQTKQPLHQWRHMLTQTDLFILTLCRALIFNPEVIVMERLLGQLSENKCDTVLKLLRDHIDNNGLFEHGDPQLRRPRTILFCALDGFMGVKAGKELPQVLDAAWFMDMDGHVQVQNRGVA